MKIIKSLLILSLLFFSFNFSNSQSLIPQQLAAQDEYHLVWQDNFDGTELNEDIWTVEIDGKGGGNNELQYYRRENISIGPDPETGENCLIITAKKENFNRKTCTSGRLRTVGKMYFKYGKIEARIKLPKTANGLWPAFWMMGNDYPQVGWPKCGEIDILEMGHQTGIRNGTQDRYFNSHFHWGESWPHPNWGKTYTHPTSIQEKFGIFTLIWDENSLKTYYGTDENPLMVNIVTMNITGSTEPGSVARYFHKPFYPIFNLAIGGNFPGIWDINDVTALNDGDAHMYVDYIRVYQRGVEGEEYYGPELTSVKSPEIKNKFIVYPNPSTHQICVDGETIPERISIYDLSGKKVLAVKHSKIINTSKLSSGNYLLKVVSIEGRIETHQVTII